MNLKEQALSVYKSAFPLDTDEFASTLTDRFFEEKCRFILKDGQIVSILYLLDCELKTTTKNYKAAYLYAAATLPHFRGNGLMSSLIEKVKKEMAQKGMPIITKPATDSLFEYYGKMGFKTVFYENEKKIPEKFDSFKEVTVEEYTNIREKLLTDIPHVFLNDSDFAYKGLKLLADEDACMAIDIIDGKEEIKEYLDRKSEFNFSKRPFAMILNPDDITIPKEAYMGIAID